MVWLETSVRGVKALGYEPNLADLEVLKKERDSRLINSIEPASGTQSALNNPRTRMNPSDWGRCRWFRLPD